MNVYKKVITELVRGDFTSVSVVWEIAKTNPSVLLRAIEKLRKEQNNKQHSDEWRAVCADLMRNGLKVNAIKACRAATGMGLAEAKHAVESLEL